jgi:ppGpp synthetase/RelA/SpoT-type nucleotidyltranferase
MQDIAGCRAIVPDLAQQDRAVNAIASELDSVTILDRREKPSHGYRAVHLIVRVDGKPIEVQIRTSLQHVWAEVSEKLADMIDPSIKYGGGPMPARQLLDSASTRLRLIEELEAKLTRLGAIDSDLARQMTEARDEYVNNVLSIIKES